MTQNKGKVFNFNDQRRIGDIGESDFVTIYENLKPKKSENDFKIDFTLGDGKTVELKTDSYDMEKTKNFFMEQNTVSGDSNKLGGPWRSKEHKIDFFVYYFVKNKKFFWFKTEPLCELLDKYITENKLKPITIPNKSKSGYYNSFGFKIPRDSVSSLLIEYKLE